MNIPFEVTDWLAQETSEHKGETGIATWRTIQHEKVKVRVVEYSPGYKANHWCSKGHIVYCLEGEFVSHLMDGREFVIKKGMSYQATDDPDNPHLSTTESGCTLWIVDGEFLKM